MFTPNDSKSLARVTTGSFALSIAGLLRDIPVSIASLGDPVLCIQIRLESAPSFVVQLIDHLSLLRFFGLFSNARRRFRVPAPPFEPRPQWSTVDATVVAAVVAASPAEY
jgi:hypothetical protein